MNVDQIFEQFIGKRVLVVGDVMIDAYLRGKVSRISPEAPVPIVNLEKSEDRLGGAANVALNLISLGAQPIMCSVVGSDKGGETLLNLLEKSGVSGEGVVLDQHRKTTIKTRVIGDNQHLLRIDEEELTLISTAQENALLEKIKELLENNVDAVILEDYNKGVLTPKVIQEVIRMSKEAGVPITVDPKKDHFFEYKGVTLFKPNLKELKEGIGRSFEITEGKEEFESAVDELESKLENQLTFITLSEHGVFIKDGSEKNYIPAHIRKIADVSGAGDTVISVATLCLAAGLEPRMIADIANLAGGLVCEISGVVPVDKSRLMDEVQKLIAS